MTSAAVSYEQVKAALWMQPGARVHAVVDASVVPELQQRVDAADVLGWDRLQRGELSPERAARASYVVALKPQSAFTDWLLGAAAVEFAHWGVLFSGAANLQQVREHGRSLNEVELPDGQRRAWRWWDPQVLELLVPTFTASQLDRFFAIGQALVLPAAHAWTWFALHDGELRTTVRPLLATTASSASSGAMPAVAAR
ncbi:MAG: hypothetical protein JWQ11_1360 [Rhizobacter sp.]|nr:hypothetical protein [Rhizobacter sp.]